MANQESATSYEEVCRQRLLDNKQRFEELGLLKLSEGLKDVTKSEKKTEQRVFKPKRTNIYSIEPQRSSRARNLVPSYRDDVGVELPTFRKRSKFSSSSESYLAVPIEEVRNATHEQKARAFKYAEKLQNNLQSGNPSFVKSMVRSHVYSTFWLGLPTRFCEDHLPKSTEPTDMMLEDEEGSEYEVVYISKRTGLSGGWRGFALYHKLHDGDALVFELTKPLRFKVYIVRAFHGQQRNEDDEESVEEVVSEADTQKEVAKGRKKGRRLNQKIHRSPRKLSEVGVELPTFRKRSKFSSSSESYLAVPIEEVRNATDEQKARAFKYADKLQNNLQSGNPSFVKSMVRSHVYSCFWLGLPTRFCEDHLPKSTEPTDMMLEDEEGSEYEVVYISKRTGLSGGWRGFALYHKLHDGDALVFELTKPLRFKVYIVRAFHGQQRNEDDDESVEEVASEADTQKEVAKGRKKGRRLNQKIHRSPRKLSEVGVELPTFRKRSKFSSSSESYLAVPIEEVRNATDEQKARAFKYADKLQNNLQSGNPSFVKSMVRSHVYSCFWLGLPTRFCEDHLPKSTEPTDMMLEDEEGSEYEVVYISKRTGLSGGWRGFALYHKLHDGDALVFELTKPLRFKVYIVRAFHGQQRNEDDDESVEEVASEADTQKEVAKGRKKVEPKNSSKSKKIVRGFNS